ncbi:hypothetical protein ACFLSS_03930 [Bacteroidota bacterium]
MKNRFYRTVFSFLLVSISLYTSTAQSLNFQIMPNEKLQFGYSFSKPFYSSNLDMSALSGVHQLSFNIPLSSKFNITGDIPYISTSYESDYGYGTFNYEESGFCNIYIGVQTNPVITDGARSIFSFGVFLPTAEEKASFNGLFINYYDIQKYLPNSVGIYFNYAYHKITNENIFFGVEVGPNILIPTEDDVGDTEIFIHYGFNVGYLVSNLALSVEFIGIAIVTASGGNLGDRLINLLDFGAQFNGTVISPKIFYKIYLKEGISDVVDGVLGLGFSVSID